MRIRKVKKEELIEAIKLITSIFPNAKIEITNDDNIYLATDKKKIVGFLHIISKHEKLILQGIGIKPTYRGNHIGTQLMGYLIKNAKDRQIFLKVKDNNFIAQTLYEKFGFIPKKYGNAWVLVRQPEN